MTVLTALALSIIMLGGAFSASTMHVDARASEDPDQVVAESHTAAPTAKTSTAATIKAKKPKKTTHNTARPKHTHKKMTSTAKTRPTEANPAIVDPAEVKKTPKTSTKDKAMEEKYHEGDPFVALGDSTQALAPTKVRIKSDNGCIHNENNWPEQVAKALQLPLTDLSCAGAKVGRYWKQPLNRLGRKTKLVVVSYGSNDFGTVNGFFRADRMPGTQRITQKATREEVELELLRVLRDIRKRAPKAIIITVGYLPLMRGGNCPQIMPNISLAEQRKLEIMRAETDMAVETASELAGPNVYNLSLRNVKGHDLCHPDDTFIINHGPGVRFHYNNAGVRFVANKVIALYHRILAKEPETILE